MNAMTEYYHAKEREESTVERINDSYLESLNSLEKLEAENAKLRELVADMWFWCYEGHMDSESQEWQMKHIDGVLSRMHELGVEVDE